MAILTTCLWHVFVFLLYTSFSLETLQELLELKDMIYKTSLLSQPHLTLFVVKRIVISRLLAFGSNNYLLQGTAFIGYFIVSPDLVDE